MSPALLVSSSSNGAAPASPHHKATHSVPSVQLALARALLDDAQTDVSLTGHHLALGNVVGAARRDSKVTIDSTGDIKAKIEESVLFLKGKVSRVPVPSASGSGTPSWSASSALRGHAAYRDADDLFTGWQLGTSIYGVTTGFGGVSSLSTRSESNLRPDNASHSPPTRGQTSRSRSNSRFSSTSSVESFPSASTSRVGADSRTACPRRSCAARC